MTDETNTGAEREARYWPGKIADWALRFWTGAPTKSGGEAGQPEAAAKTQEQLEAEAQRLAAEEYAHEKEESRAYLLRQYVLENMSGGGGGAFDLSGASGRCIKWDRLPSLRPMLWRR